MHLSLPPQLIGVDWGTSSLRAYLMGDDGVVIDTRSDSWGIRNIPDRDFSKALSDSIGDWFPVCNELPIIASGMIGSRGGWREIPYSSCPADPQTLAAGLLTVEFGLGEIHIVPGVLQQEPMPDVMRGEETQILGALAKHPHLAESSLFVLPGTHCKWVLVRNGLIESFSTHITGELFAALKNHSILGQPALEAKPEKCDEAFLRGIRTAKNSACEAVSSRLFSVRSLFLTGAIKAEHTLEYLSGLLIGEEIRSALSSFDDTSLPTIMLIGDAALCSRYETSLAEFNYHQVHILQDTAARGLWEIAKAQGLVQSANVD